jgi:hypothetical protein
MGSYEATGGVGQRCCLLLLPTLLLLLLLLLRPLLLLLPSAELLLLLLLHECSCPHSWLQLTAVSHRQGAEQVREGPSTLLLLLLLSVGMRSGADDCNVLVIFHVT